MKVTARAQRSDGWWAVEVPEVPGVFTQAKRLEQVPDMVADAVALMTGVETVEVSVEPVMDPDTASVVLEALEASAATVAAQQRASRSMRAAVRRLSAAMPARDVASILHVSHQRVSQLAK